MAKNRFIIILTAMKLVFALEIKAILQADVKKELDKNSLYGYLAYQYTMGENTFFKNVKKVLAGNIVIFENNNLTVKKYWDIEESFVKESEEIFL